MKLSRDPEYLAWLEANKPPRKGAKLLTYKGQSKTVAQWSKILGFKRPKVIHNRLLRGWTVEQALETPEMCNQYQ